MIAVGQKMNGKYIENPFFIDEYIDFIDEILTEGSDMNQLYDFNKKLRAVEIAKNILNTYENSTHLQPQFITLLEKPKSLKLCVVTEPWSIETAHILFFLKEIEKHGNGKISVLLFLRDTSPEIVEKVLEDSNANLPKIILLDRKNEIKYFWGPRTVSAESEYQKLLLKKADMMERYRVMQDWYKNDKGITFQKEFMAIINEIFKSM